MTGKKISVNNVKNIYTERTLKQSLGVVRNTSVGKKGFLKKSLIGDAESGIFKEKKNVGIQ